MTTLERLSTALQERYAIERELGAELVHPCEEAARVASLQ